MRQADRMISGLLDGRVPDVHVRRRQAVYWAVGGLVKGGRLSLTGLGRGGGGKALAKHRIKRADRLLGNTRLNDEMDAYYTAIAAVVIGATERVAVLVDWCKVAADSWALVAAVPASGRAIPILSEVHPEAVQANPVVEIAFLKRLKQIVPSGCRPILVTDAAFRSDWQMAVRDAGMDFVARLSGVARLDRGAGWESVLELAQSGGRRTADFGMCTVTKTRRVAARVVRASHPRFSRKPRRSRKRKALAHSQKKAKKAATRSWLLATSLELPAEEVIAVYGLRMQIEETFRDDKSPRFGWCLRWARCRSHTRIENLLLIAALGALVLILVGRIGERTNVRFTFQANTVRNRRVLSLLTLARAILTSSVHDIVTLRRLRREVHKFRAWLSTLPGSGEP